MRAIDIAVSAALPEDLRQNSYNLDQKGLAQLLAQVATSHPDKFAEIAKRLGDLGRHAAYQQGYTISAKDMEPVLDRKQMFMKMDAEVKALRKQKLTPAEFAERRNEIFMQYSDVMEKDTMKAALGRNNAWAVSAASGARGNAAHVRAILTTPGLFADTKGRVIPLFVRNSYSDGVRPAELLAGSYGSRLSVVATKACLRRGTLVQMADGAHVEIQNLKVGDMVVGVNKDGITSPTRVARVIDQGIQEVWNYDLAFSNSVNSAFSIQCTDNHRVLMNDTAPWHRATSSCKRGNEPAPARRLIHARDILPMSKLGVASRQLALSSGGEWSGRSEPWALFLGLMLGDGGVTRQANSFSCADPLLLEHVREELASLRIKLTKANDNPADFAHRVTTINYSPADNNSIVRGVQGFVAGSRNSINQALEDHALQGKYSWEKSLPPSTWEWDDASVSKLIAAYFACDGCIYETENSRGRKQVSISFSSTSRELIEDLRKILRARYGIHCAEIDTRTRGGFSNSAEMRVHPLYVTAIGRHGCVTRFVKLFAPFTPGIKRERMTRLIENYELKQLNPYAKASLRSKHFEGFQPCWDIEVEHPDHLFMLANGLVVSNSTAKGGDFGKQLVQNASNYNITEKDCGTDNGIDLDPDDESLIGRVTLSGEAIDRQGLAAIRKQGKPVIVRSPLTCRARHGLCAKCAGLQADGKFPQVGDSLGVTAATAVREPIVQGSLRTKHNAGAAKGQREFAGFDYINQFVQIPDEFKDKATVAEADGDVEKIEPAAQGGNYVTVNGIQHYTLPGFALRVKPGDKVEAGDFLSDGLANPADIVRLRGMGEGRKYYADRLQQMLKDSGYPADRRNLEIIAKSAVDNYRIEDPEDEDMLPDSLVRENEFLATYRPPDDTKDESPNSAVGGYLQKPVLHYTVGTRVTPKIAERISRVGVAQVPVSRKEPWFKSDMVRLRAAAHDSDDWLRSMGTSYLSKQLQQSVEAGEDTNVNANYHYGPRLAYGVDAGSGGFGEKVKETGMF